MKHIKLTTLLFFVSISTFCQTKIPPLWLNQHMEKIQTDITGKHDSLTYDKVMDQGYFHGVQFMSNFGVNDDKICVVQYILFLTDSKSWTDSLLVTSMGFARTDSALVKKTDFGILVARTRPDEIESLGELIKCWRTDIQAYFFVPVQEEN